MKGQITNENIIKGWSQSNYKKRAYTPVEKIAKTKRMKVLLNIFEFLLVINSGFLITSCAFMILFQFEKEIVLFSLMIAGIFCFNIYSYCYTKKEYFRMKRNITKRSNIYEYRKHQKVNNFKSKVS